MRIVRCSTAGNSRQWGALQDNGSVRILNGSLARSFTQADETIVPLKWLPPVEPPAIYCNHHIKECSASVPERPIVFMKGHGTVILTGTPHGVGMARKPPRWLQPGDKMEIEIENIGRLSNTVELAA